MSQYSGFSDWAAMHYAVQRISSRLIHDIEAVDDIKFNELLIMVWVHKAGDYLTPSDLAERLHVTRGAISRLLRNLAQQGYISTRPSSVDRREIEVRLQDSGIELLHRVIPTFAESLQKHFVSAFTTEERELLLSLFLKSGRVAVPAGDTCPFTH